MKNTTITEVDWNITRLGCVEFEMPMSNTGKGLTLRYLGILSRSSKKRCELER